MQIYRHFHNRSFNSLDLYLFICSCDLMNYCRSSAYQAARKLKSAGSFARVFKVLNFYFVIEDEESYNYLWNCRVIAKRNDKKSDAMLNDWRKFL